MNLQDRNRRDTEIMKAVRSGVDAMAIAKQHRLTLNRVNQIIERERWKKERQSRARAAKAKRG